MVTNFEIEQLIAWLNSKLRIESDECMDRFYPDFSYHIAGYIKPIKGKLLKDYTIIDIMEQDIKCP